MRAMVAFFIVGLLAFPALADFKTVPQAQSDIQLSYAPLVKQAAPAVVNIYTTKTVRTRSISPLFNDPFFRRFFGDAFSGVPEGGKQRKVQNSLGSGVIVDSAGTIVTNHHVIDGADDIKVVLNDRREYEAKVLGSDERTDLAVLKVETEGDVLPSLALGNSDALEVGDLVLAIGNPFGVGQTVTSGIVSALARTQVGITDYSFFIQTDAAINPGNSGGALVNMQGQLIGVNSAIYSRGGGSNGIGFAIPVSMVRSVISGVNENGQIVRPWLGASGQSVTQDLALSFGLNRPKGVLVDEIYKGGPADQAGLRRGDIILAIDGHEINDPQGLRFRLATVELGKTVNFSILRRGSPARLEFIAQAPEENPRPDQRELEGAHPLKGAVVVNLSPGLNDQLGWDMMERGVAILKILRASTANRLGFRPGDRIFAVNGVETRTVSDLVREVSRYEGQSGDWVIGVVRNGKRLDLRFRS